MNNIGLLFLIAFLFFLFGQILWSIGILSEAPLFGSELAEDWTINIIFTLTQTLLTHILLESFAS